MGYSDYSKVNILFSKSEFIAFLNNYLKEVEQLEDITNKNILLDELSYIKNHVEKTEEDNYLMIYPSVNWNREEFIEVNFVMKILDTLDLDNFLFYRFNHVIEDDSELIGRLCDKSFSINNEIINDFNLK